MYTYTYTHTLYTHIYTYTLYIHTHVRCKLYNTKRYVTQSKASVSSADADPLIVPATKRNNKLSNTHAHVRHIDLSANA